MFKNVVLFISLVILFGCRPVNVNHTPGNTSQMISSVGDISQSSDVLHLDGNLIHLHVSDVELGIPRPANWETYETEFGVVLAEHVGSVAVEGRLSGLLIHIFVPPLENFPQPISDDQNVAWAILSKIIENPSYVGNASVSEPVAFEWDGHHAAYYLMDNGEGNVTIVVGVSVPGRTQLVASSISAPASQAQRIRHILPRLLNNLRVNGVVLRGTILDSLPDPLQFPHHDGLSSTVRRSS